MFLEKLFGNPLKTIIAGTSFMSCFLLLFYYIDDGKLIVYTKVFTDPTDNPEPGYLVSSSVCKILDIDPFNDEAMHFHRPENYTTCSKPKLLTYVSKIDNIATLHLDNNTVPSYSKDGVVCCYSNITRKYSDTTPDDHIDVSDCVPFNDTVTLRTHFVFVKCENAKSKKTVYENVHSMITITEEVKKKLPPKHTPVTPISVLLVGIDSVSRLNLIRSMPHTYAFIEQHGWVPLKGYNKVADNTYPNLLAMLAGLNLEQGYRVCKPTTIGGLDSCEMAWKTYRKFNYVTAYAEDEGSIGTFNYNKKGYKDPPTDYYYRSYVLATEKLLKPRRVDGMLYCTGPETAGERIMNLAKDFVYTLKNYSYFGFFWMNSFSHNELNAPSTMDIKVRDFFEEIRDNGVLNKSIVVFISDHGIRFGKIRYTHTGWYEERLPFLYMSFPPWFKEKYSKEYETILGNVNKLTTPYDLHMTFQHLLVMSGFNYQMKPSMACPKCKSLFKKIEHERSCGDAEIAQHWCTCTGYEAINITSGLVRDAAKYVLHTIEDTIHSKNGDNICAKFSLKKIMHAGLSKKLTHRNETYLLLTLQTKPQAVFEATLIVNEFGDERFELSGSISRLDAYAPHSKCANDSNLKRYCYCQLK